MKDSLGDEGDACQSKNGQLTVIRSTLSLARARMFDSRRLDKLIKNV